MSTANLEFRGSRKDEENKEKARVRKNTSTHRCSITFSMVIHDLIFMCHCRYRTLSDWCEEAGNHENRPRENLRIELRRVWQFRYEKEHSKGGSSKGRDHTATHSTSPWSQPSNSWNAIGQTNSWNRSLNPSQQSSDTVWQRNLKRRTGVPMDLDFMTAPIVDEFGHAACDNTIWRAHHEQLRRI